MKHFKTFAFIILCLPLFLKGQSDSTQWWKYTSFVLPFGLITLGSVAVNSDWAQYQQRQIKEELQEDIDRKITIDDFSQYASMVAVYGLNLCGVKGKHNFKDRTIILATAYLLMGTSVNTLKLTVRERRPDKTSYNSFPSGHTATAFMGAEFLWQEYKNVNVLVGLSGYAVALGTGFFRMYNNRHWLCDVFAGMGIGLLSTKIAYLLFPVINKAFFGSKENNNISLGLCSQGVGLVYRF